MSSAEFRDLAYVPRHRWRAWILLTASAVIFFGALTWLRHHLDLRMRATTPVKEAGPRVTHPVQENGPLDGLDRTGQERLGNELRMLNRDWSKLLTAMVPQGKNVRLLSLEVNPASGGITVVGQSPDPVAANAYAHTLGRSDLLKEVRLLRIEEEAGSITFEVSAQWQ